MKKNLLLLLLGSIPFSLLAQATQPDQKAVLTNDVDSFVARATGFISQLMVSDNTLKLQETIQQLQSQSQDIIQQTERVYNITENWRNEVFGGIAGFTVLREKYPSAASAFMSKAINAQTNPYPTAPGYYVLLKDVSESFSALRKAKTQKRIVRLSKSVQSDLDAMSATI